MVLISIWASLVTVLLLNKLLLSAFQPNSGIFHQPPCIFYSLFCPFCLIVFSLGCFINQLQFDSLPAWSMFMCNLVGCHIFLPYRCYCGFGFNKCFLGRGVCPSLSLSLGLYSLRLWKQNMRVLPHSAANPVKGKWGAERDGNTTMLTTRHYSSQSAFLRSLTLQHQACFILFN